MIVPINPNLPPVEPVFKLQSPEDFSKEFSSSYVQTSLSSNQVLVPIRGHALKAAVYYAYSYHKDLIIDPNDWWTTVVQQLAKFLSDRGEEFRDLFVNFDGKKELMAFITTDNKNGWESFMNDVAEDICQHTKFNLQSVISPDFSTTTSTHKACINGLLMKGMENYFGYTCVSLCGIRNLKMLGSEEDYHKLVEKAKSLLSLPDSIVYYLKPWMNRVISIFENLLATFQGSVDIEFWNTIYSEISRGSGEKEITGWLKDLVCHTPHGEFLGGKRLGKYESMPVSIVEVDFKWDNNGTIHEYMKLHCGLIGVEVLNDGQAYKPISGWVIYDNIILAEEEASRKIFRDKVKNLCVNHLIFPTEKAYDIVKNDLPVPTEVDPLVIQHIQEIMDYTGHSKEDVVQGLYEKLDYYPEFMTEDGIMEISMNIKYNILIIHFMIKHKVWPYEKAAQIFYYPRNDDKEYLKEHYNKSYDLFIGEWVWERNGYNGSYIATRYALLNKIDFLEKSDN